MHEEKQHLLQFFVDADENTNTKVSLTPGSLQYQQRWTSLFIAYIGTFVMFIQNSIYWASLWPYLSQIDSTATESFFGVVVSAYSVGSVVAAPLLGWWASRIKQTRRPIIVGTLVNIAGNMLCAFVESFPSHRKWVLLLARFVTGFGAGNAGSLLAYVAMASTYEERNKAMSFHAATISLAVLAGPGLQAALVAIGYPGTVLGELRFNMYTAPAYISMLLGVGVIVAMTQWFREYHVAVVVEDRTNSTTRLPSFDKLAALVCIWCRFVILFCVTYDNTIGSAFSMVMFSWSRAEAVLYNGLIQAVAGILDFFGNLVVGNFLLRFLKERNLMVIGLFSFLLFYVVSFSYPWLPSLIPHIAAQNYATITNSSSQLFNGTHCAYSWCTSMTRIAVWQYILAYVFLQLAFSLGFAPCATLYSKIIGPRFQGTSQGIFLAGGNFAMALGPIVVSLLFEYYGPRIAWFMASSLLAFSMLLVIAFHRRLLPLRI